MAFTVTRDSNSRGVGHSCHCSNSGKGHTKSGHGRGGRRNYIPHCQICKTEGHTIDRFCSQYDCAEQTAQLAEAFTSSCSLSNGPGSDWYLDTGASSHMTLDPSQLVQTEPYMGKGYVVVGNGASLPISHTGTLSSFPHLKLFDVLVVPSLTKNLLSICKLTSDLPLSVTFSNDCFLVQNRITGKVVATGKRDGGLYVLEGGNTAFISILKNKTLSASYDLWHACLGHVNHSTISLLNKKGQLSLSSLLPNPTLCSTCQLAKSHRLPFCSNDNRCSSILIFNSL